MLSMKYWPTWLVNLSEWFSISVRSISNYFSKWICFLYYHLTEIDSMPTFSQVEATLPHNFKEKYPNTFAIIDASEFFLVLLVLH